VEGESNREHGLLKAGLRYKIREEKRWNKYVQEFKEGSEVVTQVIGPLPIRHRILAVLLLHARHPPTTRHLGDRCAQAEVYKAIHPTASPTFNGKPNHALFLRFRCARCSPAAPLAHHRTAPSRAVDAAQPPGATQSQIPSLRAATFPPVASKK
jgi:hypothetical protein